MMLASHYVQAVKFGHQMPCRAGRVEQDNRFRYQAGRGPLA